MTILELISQIAETEGTDEDVYDINSSIDAVVRYMKHLMRDHQQRKAKAYCFDNLEEDEAFWLKDFAQKVIPIRYREGQREYFGKKGMSLHIDVSFRKEKESLLKYVYMTCLFRCKQSMIDVLNIGDNVLNKFKQDCPFISKMYAKSDNAGCYHGNYVLEALYKLCLAKGLTLLRYDFNEPCKGKDQCDRESAGAKAVINSFVNSGNDLLTAEDLCTALHYGKGIKNTQACVLEIDLQKSTLGGTEIKHVSAYHSVQFFPHHMKMYRYYNIGLGVIVNYSSDTKFVPAYQTITPFSYTQHEDAQISKPSSQQKQKKRRIDHQLCRLVFCENPLCSDVFESLQAYEEHMLSEKHTIENQTSSMDKVRATYVAQMKVSSQLHSVLASTECNLADVMLSESLIACPMMKRISGQGWGLPHRVSFRYTYEQKIILYNIFMEGEKTNKKKSAEETELIIRKKLKPHQYVTSTQIRSLFSTFAKKLKDGTLSPPTPKSVDQSKDDETPLETDELKSNETSSGESIDDDYAIDLGNEVHKVLSEIADREAGVYVAVRYDDLWFPGRILSVHDDGSVDVMCMEYVDKFNLTNKFRWPADDHLTYDREDLLLKIDEPTKITSGKRIQYYKLRENDFDDACDVLKLVQMNS